MTKLNKQQYGVKSVETGLEILDVLIDKGEPMKLKDIAQVMQMPPAKIHRYLVSLSNKKYVKQLSNGNYTQGARIEATRLIQLNQHNIMDKLNKIALEIKNSFNCGVQIAQWFDEAPIVIQSIDSNELISINTRIGSRMPLVYSATGKLLASYQAIETIKNLVLIELRERQNNISTDNIVKDRLKEDITDQCDDFLASLPEIKEQGYSYITGHIMTGINAFSIAVNTTNDTDTTPLSSNQIYAITAIGTAEQLPIGKKQKIIKQMLTTAQKYGYDKPNQLT